MGGRLPRPVPLSGASEALRAEPGIYCGATIRETTGSAAAVVRIYDNASAASGPLLETVGLAQGESVSVHHAGVWAESGLYVEVVSGDVEGSVYLA